MEKQPYVVVVGGLNMDIAGLCGHVYREKDSNIGTVALSAGGVGHNIAQNIAKLGVPVELVTVFGDDHFGRILEEECEKDGIGLHYAQKVPGGKSCTYLYITDSTGEMMSAINAMALIDCVTPEFLEERKALINGAALCVVDANICEAGIQWLAENCTVPMYADPVSTIKLPRLKPLLPRLEGFKPNALEAQLLTGIEITDEASAKKAADKLLGLGIQNVFISMGKDGIFCCNKDESALVPIVKTEIVSVNGAGDCSMAVICWARCRFGKTLSMRRIGEMTQKAASLTLQTSKTVSPLLCEEALI